MSLERLLFRALDIRVHYYATPRCRFYFDGQNLRGIIFLFNFLESDGRQGLKVKLIREGPTTTKHKHSHRGHISQQSLARVSCKEKTANGVAEEE